jgi:hypothetical protein
MRFRALSLLVGVAVLALTAGGVLASVDTLDQHQDGASATAWDAGDFGTAQTFTAAISGHLDRVSLWGLDSLGGTLTGVDLRSGGPSGALLGTSSSATPVNGAWFDAVFSPTVQVAAGSMYAIVLHTSGAVRIGGTCSASAYTLGEALGSTDGGSVWQTLPALSSSCIADFAFEEWVIPGAVTAPPTVAMAFGAASIPVGGTTSLTFTITNPNVVVPTVTPALQATATLTNIGFTDTLPAGLLIATPNNIGGGCGGAITAAAGTNLVSITGLTLAAGATCGFGVDVIGTTAGTKSNATTAVTSVEAGAGNIASASVVVAAAATPTPGPTAAPTPAAPTAAPTVTAPPTSTVDGRSSGSEAPPLPLVALAAITGLGVTGLILRRETGLR